MSWIKEELNRAYDNNEIHFSPFLGCLFTSGGVTYHIYGVNPAETSYEAKKWNITIFRSPRKEGNLFYDTTWYVSEKWLYERYESGEIKPIVEYAADNAPNLRVG